MKGVKITRIKKRWLEDVSTALGRRVTRKSADLDFQLIITITTTTIFIFFHLKLSYMSFGSRVANANLGGPFIGYAYN